MIVVPSQPATVVRTPQVVDVNTYKGDLKPGMVLSDGAVVVSVGPSVPAAETVVPASK